MFSGPQRAALRLADALASTPAVVSEELYAEVSEHFSQRELVELSSAIAWENYRARFNRVFSIESEDYSAGGFCPLPMEPPER